MKDIKITLKIVISCIIVSAFSLFLFEFIYNQTLYKKYIEMYNEVQDMKYTVDVLTKIVLKNHAN